MASVPGYVLRDPLLEGAATALVRGTRRRDGAPVIVKLLSSDDPLPWDVAVLRREYEVCAAMAAGAALQPLELVRGTEGIAVVFEEFDGVPLSAVLGGGSLEVPAALALALSAARALAVVHGERVIHKNVTPASLLVSVERGDARLIDFSICTRLDREATQGASASLLEGSLAYVSPEQTGRMNRSVDPRSDLYSLGVTLYEMLTGEPPFRGEDPLELIHAHIARRPVPPIERDTAIPEVVSDLVLRLLAKRAEDRYQSAEGLAADLEACLHELRTTGHVSPRTLGTADVSHRLEVPERLYGREAELADLLTAFQSVGEGRTKLVLVTGYSGVGKSALVGELHGPVVARRATFVAGKFDQFRRDSPYSALIQALTQLMQSVLAGSDDELASWRSRLRPVLGDQGALLTELIPGLEVVVGPQPAVQDLPPVEAQARFQLLLAAFVRAFARREHPLVVFLDDLQWADSGTLALLRSFTADEEGAHMLLLGAYRDNEVDVHHPLALALDAIVKSGGDVQRLALGPLEPEHLSALLSDTLGTRAEEVARLTELVHAKTGGNPFHVRQFLRSLTEQGLLSREGERGRWAWDVDRIARQEITSNVVDLMIEGLQRLPEATQELLRLAACVGSRFDLEVLAVVAEEPRRSVAEHLWPAVREGLVLPVGTGYKLVTEPGADPEENSGLDDLAVQYRFLHDRVQQAAYALIGEDARLSTHLRIGRLLRDDRAGGAEGDALFDVVGHLNLASELIADPGERIALARADLAASRRAIRSSAFGPAASFARAGIGLLPEGPFAADYSLALDLHLAATEAEYMRLDVEAGRVFGDLVLAHARRPLDTMLVWGLRVQHAITEGQLEEAIADAREALRSLGIDFPATPSLARVVAAFLRIRLRLAFRSLEHLERLPPMEDPEKLAAMEMLLRVSPAAYQSDPNILALIIAKEMELILDHGTSYHAAQAYSSWAVLLCEVLGDVKGTYAFGRLGVDVAHACSHKDVQSRSIFYFTAFAQHWAEPQRDADELLTRYQPGFLEGGDLQFFGYAVYFPMLMTFYAGGHLEPLVERFETAGAILSRLGLESMNASSSVGHQMVRNLAGLEDPPDRLAGRVFDTEARLPELVATRNRSSVFFASLMELQLAYLFGDHARAEGHATRAVEHLDAIISTIFVPQTRLYEGLTLAALARRGGRERRRRLRGARRCLRRMKRWARANPANFQGKALLLEAEIAAARGRAARAESLYEAAATAARVQGFLHEEALARELAGLHYLRTGRRTPAAAYLRAASAAYGTWGARAKVAQLRAEHGEILGIPAANASTGDPSSWADRARATLHQRSRAAVNLDLESVLRASRVISGEIVLDELLARLLEIVVQAAGAERAVLVRMEDGAPVVVGVGVAGSVELVPRAPLDDQRASASVVRLAVRTGEAQVVEDARADPRLSADPYVAARAPRSILAVPTLSKGAVTGVIYLENNLTAGAFTPDRVELLGMLASQASVSLENAELYGGLSRLTRAYERFVPRAFLEQLDKSSIVDVALGDSVECEISVLFADIRGFTRLTERMTPTEAFAFINSYLERVEPVIEARGGFVDKYQGDAIMALFFGGADDAVAAAAEVHVALAGLNAERDEAEPIRIGVGLHSGPAMLGTVGAHGRMDGTVIGDTVNLASRLEGLTKDLDARVLLSAATVGRLQRPGDVRLRRLGPFCVAGKEGAVEVYELLDALPPEVAERRAGTANLMERAALARSEGAHAVALAALRELAAADASDTVAARLAERP